MREIKLDENNKIRQYTLNEVANRLNVSRITISREIKRGNLKARRIGTLKWINAGDLEDYLRGGKKESRSFRENIVKKQQGENNG